MKPFTDKKNRQWQIEINVASIKRVRDLLDIDLLAVTDDETIIERVGGDPILLADLLWVLCEEQARAQGISDEDFGRALAGDAIDAATDAFLGELVDFFPGRRRAALARVLVKLKEAEGRLMQTIETLVDGPMFESQVDQALIELENSFNNAPASSESTPADSRSPT